MATIEKRGESYKITVSCGYDSAGRQIRRRMTWAPKPGMTPRQIEKELERQKVLFEEKCSADLLGGNIKFEAFTRQWFEEYADGRLKVRTIDRYHQMEGRVFAAIGHLRVDKITTRVLQRFVHGLQQPGENLRTGGGLSPKTVKNHLSFVSSVLDYAVSQGMIRDNPCRGVALPSIPSVERDCYTLEEAQRFLELLEQEPANWRVFFTLAIYGGFRRGELYGLEWKDIDFDTGIITINRTSLHTKEKGTFTDTPKTKGSRRSLKMPEEIIKMLRQYRAGQNLQRLQAGDQWKETDRLFVAWDGTPMNPNSVENWLIRFTKRTGMRRVSVHSFRHLNASLLIHSGTDVRTVASALGHSTPATTLNIYSHAFAEAQARATEAVADTIKLVRKRQ